MLLTLGFHHPRATTKIKQEMTADLAAMKAAGLGNLVFLEVDVGVPKGPVRCGRISESCSPKERGHLARTLEKASGTPTLRYSSIFASFGDAPGELSPAMPETSAQDLAKTLPLYPDYRLTAAILHASGVLEDFAASGPVRFGHRRTQDRDIYFVANRTGQPIKVDCRFRIAQGRAKLWDPVTGEQRALPGNDHLRCFVRLDLTPGGLNQILFGHRNLSKIIRS